jgi:hypothetical protein
MALMMSLVSITDFLLMSMRPVGSEKDGAVY